MTEEKVTEVILKIHELTTATQYGKAKITAEPVGDLLYAVQINEKFCQVREDGTRVFTTDGIRHIIKNLQVVLVVDADREDF